MSGKTIQERLSKFLFRYRIIPHATMGIVPCELLMKRRLRSSLDLLFTAVQQRVEDRQAKQKAQHDGQKSRREFKASMFIKESEMDTRHHSQSHWTTIILS